MITITKEGKLPIKQEIPMSGTCFVCECSVNCTSEDVKIEQQLDKNDYVVAEREYVDCPTVGCAAKIYVTKA
jgi:hypothetical protein